MQKGETALITGAAKGIGREIALCFARQGIDVALNYRGALPTDLVREISGLGVRCLPVQANVADFHEVKAMVETVQEEFGCIDILVNNAGITRDKLVLRMSPEDFDACLDTNLKGAFNTIRHACTGMTKNRRGTIINISSVVGLAGNVGQANYAASKAGLVGLTKSVAKELAPWGITCNAVAPGFIQTDMTEALKENIKEQMLATIPLKHFGSPDDVARTALFLVENRYITGQVLCIDGGMLMA